MAAGTIRYAVVGLGYISQVAVLPAFKHAGKNSKLQALVSGDPKKLAKLGKRYGVKTLCSYEDYPRLLQSGEIDAVYIAVPNHRHAEFAIPAAQAGIHVLCEKPMEVNSARCEEMIRAARAANVKLMVAYRLHFDPANLSVVERLKKGRIGEPRIFNSVFTMALDPKNYRAGPRALGGGPIYDIGIYCLNAARYLFRCEPIEVSALSFGTSPQPGSDSEETMGAVLRFENGQAATFVCSFGAFDSGHFHVLGTKGVVSLEQAYEFASGKGLKLETRSGTERKSFPKSDQFAPELLYFSDCVLKNREPEPSGIEGLADVRIIEAILRSAEIGRAIHLEPVAKVYPDLRQAIKAPALRQPGLVRAKTPSKKAA